MPPKLGLCLMCLYPTQARFHRYGRPPGISLARLLLRIFDRGNERPAPELKRLSRVPLSLPVADGLRRLIRATG
jgi:hypothetical protein